MGTEKKQEARGAWADVVNSCITIQRAYRKYRRNKVLAEIGVEDDCEKAEDAIVKIQAHFKGFQTRKAMVKQDIAVVKGKKVSKIVEKNRTNHHQSKVSKPVV